MRGPPLLPGKCQGFIPEDVGPACRLIRDVFKVMWPTDAMAWLITFSHDYGVYHIERPGQPVLRRQARIFASEASLASALAMVHAARPGRSLLASSS